MILSLLCVFISYEILVCLNSAWKDYSGTFLRTELLLHPGTLKHQIPPYYFSRCLWKSLTISSSSKISHHTISNSLEREHAFPLPYFMSSSTQFIYLEFAHASTHPSSKYSLKWVARLEGVSASSLVPWMMQQLGAFIKLQWHQHTQSVGPIYGHRWKEEEKEN